MQLSSTLYMYIEFALWECIQNFRRFGYSVYLCEKVKLLFDNTYAARSRLGVLQ